MAITFPRDLIEPFKPAAGCVFEPLDIQARNATRGGKSQVVELGPTIWSMKYTTVSLTAAEGMAWEAWLASLRGGRRLFKAWHPMRRYGLAYPNGYGAWNGLATRSSIGAGLDTVSFTGLPAGHILSVGDFMSWEHATNSQALHRVVEGATADGSGNATVTVEPIVRPSPGSNSVTFVKPWCHAVLDPTQSEVRWSPGRRAVVTFAAVQTL